MCRQIDGQYVFIIVFNSFNLVKIIMFLIFIFNLVAMLTKSPLALDLPPMFWKCLTGDVPTMADLKDVDAFCAQVKSIYFYDLHLIFYF